MRIRFFRSIKLINYSSNENSGYNIVVRAEVEAL